MYREASLKKKKVGGVGSGGGLLFNKCCERNMKEEWADGVLIVEGFCNVIKMMVGGQGGGDLLALHTGLKLGCFRPV